MRVLLVAALLLSALLAAYWTTRKPDNLGGRSFEREMSFLPIDVVYTWVNGCVTDCSSLPRTVQLVLTCHNISRAGRTRSKSKRFTTHGKCTWARM